jgi:hypothetical protein
MDNIKMHLRQMVFDEVEWTQEDQDKDHWRIHVYVCDKLLCSTKGKTVMFKLCCDGALVYQDLESAQKARNSLTS